MRAISLYFLAFLILCCGSAYAQCNNQYANTVEPMFCFGDTIHWVAVTFQGTEAKRLNKTDLERFVRLRLKNDLSMLNYTTIAPAELFKKIGKLPYNEMQRYMSVACNIWTVGENYPVAMYVNCVLGHYMGNEKLEQSLLGLTNRNKLDDQVHNAIRQSIEEIAGEFVEKRDNAKAIPGVPATSTLPNPQTSKHGALR